MRKSAVSTVLAMWRVQG